MRITVERVQFLKSVEIFSKIPDEVLSELAIRFKESSFVSGEPIVEKGELLDTLYVVLTGKIRIHEYKQTLDSLEKGKLFGEMALLTPEQSPVHLTVQEDTEVLSIDHQTFRDFMEEYVEASMSVIQILCMRLKEASHE